jgi:MFS family permease
MPDKPTADGEDRYRFVVLSASVWLQIAGGGSVFLMSVALKDMAAAFSWGREVPSLAYALQFAGSGAGGILMGYMLDRGGIAAPSFIGGLTIGIGAMAVAWIDSAWQLYVIYGLMFGILGQATLGTPLMANITRWYDRNRGAAVGIVASGQSLAGILWPPIFGDALLRIGWRETFFWYGVFALATMLPVTCLLLRKPRATEFVARTASGHAAARRGTKRFSDSGFQAWLCVAIVGCCVAMALPQGHLVAHLTDIGLTMETAVEVFALMLFASFVSRSLMVGLLSDRYGGLMALLIFSAVQAASLGFLILVEGIALLYLLAIIFGFGWGGIFPVYTVIVREYLPVHEVGRRSAIVFLYGAIAMAFGGWIGGYLFDATQSYVAAFLVGVAFNAGNVAVIGFLMSRSRPGLLRPALA